MEVEVLINEVHYPATIKEISGAKIRVSYKDNWRPEETVDSDKVRFPPSKFADRKYATDDIVEAAISVPGLPENIIGWQKAKITQIKGEFHKVRSIAGPDRNDVVSKECVRPDDIAYTKCSAIQWKNDEILVPEDMRLWFKTIERYTTEFARSIPGLHAEFDGSRLQLAAASLDPIKRANMVAELHFKDLRQRVQLERKRDDEVRKRQNEVTGGGGSHQEDGNFVTHEIVREGEMIFNLFDRLTVVTSSEAKKKEKKRRAVEKNTAADSDSSETEEAEEEENKQPRRNGPRDAKKVVDYGAQIGKRKRNNHYVRGQHSDDHANRSRSSEGDKPRRVGRSRSKDRSRASSQQHSDGDDVRPANRRRSSDDDANDEPRRGRGGRGRGKGGRGVATYD